MLEVFLCHGAAGREMAERIAARLEGGAEARVVLEESAVVSGWDGGMSSGAILLLLSSDSVPGRLNRADWEALLDHFTGHREPPLGCVLAGDCAYPRLLERRQFFRWNPDDPRQTLRALERWVVGLHALPEQPSFAAARLPWFEGRRRELDLLFETLVDGVGTAVLANSGVAGKTSLAQEFARQAAGHFRDILWIGCGHRPPAEIAGELAAQLGAAIDGTEQEAAALLAATVRRHRILLVLDDVRGPLPFTMPAEGCASVLITTRGGDIPEGARAIALEGVSPAIRRPDGDTDLRLWQAMSRCDPHGFPLPLAARIAGLDESEARAACERLVQLRLADPFDEAGRRFRLSALSRQACPEGSREAHARAVRELLDRRCLGEVEPALEWAIEADWPLAVALARDAFELLRSERRLAEGRRILERLRDAAALRQDLRVAEQCAWELSWIDDTPYPRAGGLEGEQLTLDLH